MKKIIIAITIISLVLSLNANILKPQKAKAFLGIGDITIDIVNQLKEWIIDEVPRTVARHFMIRLQQEIIRWAQGGFSDENKPFAMTNWTQEIKGALDIAEAKFIREFNLTTLCSPFRFTIGERLGLTRSGYMPYTDYAACTIETIVGNANNFFENPSISLYGWDSWSALMQPQNNIFGSILLAQSRKAEIELEEKEQKEKEVEAGQGYMNENECTEEAMLTEEQLAECQNECLEKCGGTEGVPFSGDATCVQSCQLDCTKQNSGVCLEYKTKNLGSTIHSAVEKATQSDIDWLISADEITELFNVVFSGLFTKLLHGTGLTNTPIYRAEQTIEKYEAQYGYYDNYKKTKTAEDIKKIKTDILNNILNAIKRISTSSYECNKDYQLKGEVFQEVSAEILDEETKHLYTAIEGIDLKPDFQVLDSTQAINNGIATLGKTWDDIPFSKYPSQCSEIAGEKCSDIQTNLPYELEIKNINNECNNGCLGRINEYRSQEDISNEEAINKAVTDGKCSSYAIGSACLSGAILINRTESRCDDCLSKAQIYCSSEDTSCIELYCSNYEDIEGISAFSAQDFYNKCSLASLKNSCNVCLKEYFMPADYCHEIYDFINRAFVKYPAQVYEDMWWGRYYEFESCANNRTINNKVAIGLTCRIMPDFIFPDGTTCKTNCNVTDEDLKNTTDNKPTDTDCGLKQWNANAYSPGGQYIPYLVRKKSKCCAALTGHEPEMYKQCRDITGSFLPTEPEEPEVEEECPQVAENCSGWIWDKNNVQDIGGASNLSIVYPNEYFNALTEPSSRADSSQLANAQIISIRGGATGANISVSQPYCWKPQDCCTDTSSYMACMTSIPSDSKCRIGSGEINKGLTNIREAKVADGKSVGDLEPMWVPDSNFIDGQEWTVYGYCSYNPEDAKDTSAYFGPTSPYAWNHQGKNLICEWTDTDQSETCNGSISQSCDLSNFTKEFWTTVKGKYGGIAVCVEK